MRRSNSKPLRDAVRENQVFRARALTGLVLVGLAFCILVARFTWLQVFQHEEFTTRSEDNRVKLRALAPNRGLIYDRKGRILADNRPAYRLELIPEQVEDLDLTLAELGALFPISEDDLERFQKLKKARHSFQSVPVRFRLTESEVARFAIDRHRFPGVDIVPYQTRVYPMGPEFAHVLGYVGRLDAEDLKRVDASRYSATAHIGKTGIESYYESELHGDVGHERVEINVQGRVLGSLEREPPASGKNLYLTIDAELQQVAMQALSGYTGAIVAVEPLTGDLLALVSAPSFDPNQFIGGVSRENYQTLISSPDRPLFNRALQGGYEPGSTLKPYIALAGLESGTIPLSHTVFSSGFFQLPGQDRRYRDWKRGGHGSVDVVGAIEQSVNVFFYQLAYDLGINSIHDYLAQFGFGQPTGIDLRGESSGILPSTQWKRQVHGLPWYPGETVITGIGQGFTVTTPLQLAQAAAVIAARGHSPRIHLMDRLQDPASGDWEAPTRQELNVPIVDNRNWEAVIQGMARVIHGERGTARPYWGNASPYQFAGKSGTAQVYGLEEGEEYVEEEVATHLRHHALFIAFAPVESPQIAVSVVVEHGGGGARVAAPIARRVIDAYLGDGSALSMAGTEAAGSDPARPNVGAGSVSEPSG